MQILLHPVSPLHVFKISALCDIKYSNTCPLNNHSQCIPSIITQEYIHMNGDTNLSLQNTPLNFVLYTVFTKGYNSCVPWPYSITVPDVSFP